MERSEYLAFIQYNLANVYHALGEFNAALELWNTALQSQNASLLYKILYNRGILLYEQGRYEEAFESFKAALGYNSSSISAKINLELALVKIQTGRETSVQGERSEEEELSSNSLRILEFVRRKEEQLLLNSRQNRETGVNNALQERDW